MISREASSSKRASMPNVSDRDARALTVRVYIEVSNGMSPTACCPNIFESEVFSMFQNGKRWVELWGRGLAGWSQEAPCMLNCSPIQFLFYFISHALFKELYRTQVHYAFITMDKLNK